jgi:folate-binding protein YgfZ
MNSTPPLAAWNMQAVDAFAQAVGGIVSSDPCGPSIDVGQSAVPDAGGVAPLADLGLLSVTGDEGARFLHAQITNDVEHLDPGVARWGGYCSAKGRLQATFRYWRDPAAIHLVVARPLAQALARRLSMFVLRAKAKVLDTSDGHAVFGLLGRPAADAAAAALGLAVPAADGAASAGGAHLIGLPPLPGDHAHPRWLLAVPAPAAAATWAALTGAATPMTAQAWRRTEVLAGIPRIVPGTFEQFVPQMINFESVDGVNFRKGCYPGQEVVARSQYLGKLKRRMFLGHGRGPLPAPGSDVVPVRGGEACGRVVLAAPDGADGFELLFESQVAEVEAGPLQAGGVTLALRTLPYPLKAID